MPALCLRLIYLKGRFAVGITSRDLFTLFYCAWKKDLVETLSLFSIVEEIRTIYA